MNYSNMRITYTAALCIIIGAFILMPFRVFAIGDQPYITTQETKNCFTFSASGKSAPLYVSARDFPGVIRALNDLKADIGRVTDVEPELFTDKLPNQKQIIIVGTIGKSPIIDQLIKTKKIEVKEITGKWETFTIRVIEKPMKGIDKALVIAGSDKRGTIYGIYDVSQQIGVSPWYWWADVAIDHKDALYVLPGIYTQSPSVKYRGIFLNDEYPDLTNWISEKFGTVKPSQNPPVPDNIPNYNHEFYTRLFELILRLKGNYLWPAMWKNAFNEDDPENPRLADEYGIVMGTSHQEPMLRAQKEWDRRYLQKLGSWNYTKYPDTLNRFWREGIKRNKNFESIITIGLRGANDSEMAPGGPPANMALLEKIVNVQRTILADEVNPDVTKVPQMWCLYKEVQDYYEAGMRVPDDVTLLWAEDNWGNVRRLPTPEERKRSGGAGVYYHFDYHGGPRSYQWLNTSPIAKIWDQLSLAKQYGADRIWIVNVGHFKGYEFPLEYFMSLAWNTKRWTGENLGEFTQLWAEREFGKVYSNEIAEIISKYTKYNGRRKPELLSTNTYSLVNYLEAEKVVSDYKAIAAQAEEIYTKIPVPKKDAFYQLVLFPTKACAIVNELYYTAAKNALFAKQGRASANDLVNETRSLFQSDTSLMGYYNRIFANGKWNHFMDQAHLGYNSWRDPPTNTLRAVKLTEIEIPDTAAMAVSVEGSEVVWPEEKNSAILPAFDVFNQQRHYVDVFNKGKKPFDFSILTRESWIIVSEEKGSVEKDKRIWINVDWSKVPEGLSQGNIIIKGTSKEVSISIKAFNPTEITRKALQGFVEGEKLVSIEAEHYTYKIDNINSKWMRIEDYGHTLSGMRAYSSANGEAATPGKDSPCLEYKMYLFSSGKVNVKATLGPTLNFIPGRSVNFAISFDDEVPRKVTLIPEKYSAQNGNRDWEKAVEDNARFTQTDFTIAQPGYHTLKIWMIDPGIVLQKLVVDLGGVQPSYLGPPESFYNPIHNVK